MIAYLELTFQHKMYDFDGSKSLAQESSES